VGCARSPSGELPIKVFVVSCLREYGRVCGLGSLVTRGSPTGSERRTAAGPFVGAVGKDLTRIRSQVRPTRVVSSRHSRIRYDAQDSERAVRSDETLAHWHGRDSSVSMPTQ